ncbi:MAG: RimK family alpha-L-glutamate ligase [Candidatus Bathyarchaeota archaeon]|nr:RimK family alpha-L-glutamate ligase [Candidatus Bathyarchaeota archaeon]MCX8176836.1 RimK family alpha-L-glutamate ligase [Candidatus Bathyarchaeota archaeon]MDW8193480.1 RimK family alpha-L-glutamate ligase [Nitrososphaerota archaeon]
MSLQIGIVAKDANAYGSIALREALKKRRIRNICLSFPQLVARVGYKPYVSLRRRDLLEDFDALIIRPIGRGSLEEIVFRMDLLYRLERMGLYVVNPPEAIEHCVDKYDILTILEETGIPVPRTVVTESPEEALKAFHELGGDVVVKPIFGSRGIGSTRISDPDIAQTVFSTISFYHGVIYIQEFVPHGFSDIRAFVIGDHVAAAIRRVAKSWKTNYSQGAIPEPIELNPELENLAVRAAKAVRCKIAGVDILESSRGALVVEVNSQPGWKGLQSVTSVNIADEIVKYVLSELKR